MLRLSFLLVGISLLSSQSSPVFRPITIHESSIDVKTALDELSRQSGVTVRDHRDRKDDAIALNLDRVSFWQALDIIATRAKARVSLGKDGLVLGPRLPGVRARPASYDGEFRIRVQSVTASRDFETGRAACVFTLEMVWTPTLRPLFITSHAHGVRLVDGKNTSVPLVEEGGTLAPVDGRSSFTIDVTAPAPPRSEQRVALLEGKVTAVVPSKYLTFRYDADLVTLKDAVVGGEVRRLAQDDVVCRVERVVLDGERWSLRLALDYPAGGKELESFQAGALVVNNELVLVSADGKRSIPSTGYVIDSVSSRRAVVTYHFRDKPGGRLGAASQWKPRYSAVARIVEVPVRFRFHDVPLP